MIQQRNIAVCIILSIVTCGIYGIYWLYTLNEDTNAASAEQQPTSGGMVILLSIVTCGIYTMYWAYKQGEKLDRASEMRNMQKSDRAIVYLLLTIFGLGIIAYALMQDTLNKVAVVAPMGAPQQPYAQPQQPYYGQPQQPYAQPQQPQQPPYAQPQQPGQDQQNPYNF